MENKKLVLFSYACKVCHHPYFDDLGYADCPVCGTKNTPLTKSIYILLKEEDYEVSQS